jgi:ABC-type multidrug transport system fused ATPase/permease subunit
MVPRSQKIKMLLLLVPMTVTAMLNIIGVAFIMPFLAMISDPSAIHKSKKIALLYNYLGFTTPLSFTIFIGVLALTLLIVTNCFSIVTTWLSVRLIANFGAHLKRSLYEKYVDMSYENHLRNNSSALINNLFVLVPSVVDRYITPAILGVTSLISVLAIGGLVLAINPFVGLAMGLVFGSAYWALFKLIKKRLHRNGIEILKKTKQTQRHAAETFGGVKDIKLRRQEHVFKSMFSPSLYQISSSETFNRTAAVVPKFMLEMLAFGGVVGIVLWMLVSGKNVALIIPTMAVYVYAGYRLMPAMQQLFASIAAMKSTSSSVEELYNSLNGLGEEGELTKQVSPARVIDFNKSLELKDISFHYRTGTKLVLKKINMVIKKNETVGVVGTTGAGKTTLIDIILGLLKPCDGAMYLDGVDLATDENLASWQDRIGYVPQHIFLADSTIRENIAFGTKKEEIDDELVRQAAKMAALSDFIEQESSDGYNTVVGERGVRLSGGQLQRIGIARALYREPSVLVLDEATSSLDNETEADVMRAIYSMRDKITMIVIAHRLTTVEACNRIYKLDKGNIVGEGKSLKDLDMVVA